MKSCSRLGIGWVRGSAELPQTRGTNSDVLQRRTTLNDRN